MFLRSCLQGALLLRPDWSVMAQRPHPPVLRRPRKPVEAPECCMGLGLAAQDSSLPRLISSTICRLPPPFCRAFKLGVLAAFALESCCKFHGLALAPASLLISPGSPAQQPLQPGYSPTPSPPHYIHTRLLPTSSPLLKPFPGPGAPFPPLHLLVSSPLLAQDKSHLPAARPGCPTPAGLSFFLPPQWALHDHVPVPLWGLIPPRSAPHKHTSWGSGPGAR